MINRKRLIKYTGLTIIAIVTVTVLFDIFYPQLPTATHAAPQAAGTVQPVLRQDSQMITIMQRLGLDYSKLNLIYEQPPNQSTDTEGLFIAPDTIYLTPADTINTAEQVLSHEYVHYIQHSVDPSGAKSFYAYLDILETSNSWLNTRMAWHRDHYCNSSGCSIDMEAEYEAIACTEMSDSVLRPDFVKWCDKYLPDRHELL